MVKPYTEKSFKSKLSDADRRNADIITYLFLTVLVLVASIITAL